MKRKLIARPRAKLDVINHITYLTEVDPRAAARFEVAVEAAFAEITAAPFGQATCRLRRLPDVELRFKRPAGFKSYVIYFQVTDDAVFILRVLHGSQDADRELRP
jgi:plasmid stabilization system protein ParE